MKTRFLLGLLILGIVMTMSCRKETKKPTSDIAPAKLDEVSTKSSAVFSDIQSFMFNALSVAADSGIFINQPPTTSAKTELLKAFSTKSATGGTGDWYGPDHDGWYIKSWKSLGYTYTYKIRCKDTTMTNITSIEYSGGDGSYSNVYTTQYTRYMKNKVYLWKGYADWKISSFGDNDISDVTWRFEFNDWNPKTGAGVYDWFWGAHSLGGGDVPYGRFLNIIATDGGSSLFPSTNNLLHVKVTWYDGIVEVGSFDYDTTWTPVEMPEVLCAL
jgi:hypothetical protein